MSMSRGCGCTSKGFLCCCSPFRPFGTSEGWLRLGCLPWGLQRRDMEREGSTAEGLNAGLRGAHWAAAVCICRLWEGRLLLAFPSEPFPCKTKALKFLQHFQRLHSSSVFQSISSLAFTQLSGSHAVLFSTVHPFIVWAPFNFTQASGCLPDWPASCSPGWSRGAPALSKPTSD